MTPCGTGCRARSPDPDSDGRSRHIRQGGYPAAGILMRATEERLRKVEQCVSARALPKSIRPVSRKLPFVVTLGQHVALLQVVMTKDRSGAVLQKLEARLRLFLQAPCQGSHRQPVRETVERSGRAPTRMYSSLLGCGRRIRRRRCNRKPTWEWRSSVSTVRPSADRRHRCRACRSGFARSHPGTTSSAQSGTECACRHIHSKPTRNRDAGPLADPAGNQGLLRHDPHRLVFVNLQDQRLLGPREVDTVGLIGAALQSREGDGVERRNRDHRQWPGLAQGRDRRSSVPLQNPGDECERIPDLAGSAILGGARALCDLPHKQPGRKGATHPAPTRCRA